MDTNLGQVVLVQDLNPGVSEYFPRAIDPAPLDPDRPFFSPPSERPNGSFPSALVEFNDKLYFSADDGKNGRELFVSDGTGSGTQLVKDIHPGVTDYGYSYSSSPYGLVEFNDKLYFSANNGETGNELYVTDGTSEGTQLLVDLNPGENNYGSANSSYPNNLVEFNGKLYFSANNGETGNELYVTDGTGSGTELVADLRPGDSPYDNSSSPSNLVPFNDKLYFTASDGENGNELYVSDGTVGGTQLLVDLRTGTDPTGNTYGSYPSNLVEFDGKLYFTANNGESGNELYATDGTGSGTELVADINPGEGNYGVNSSYPSSLVEFNGKLYFTADNGENGNELYVSDGTAGGTQLVADINTGEDSSGNSYGSFASDLVEFDGKLYFTANNNENGSELYVSDGTTEGTQLVADIYPGLSNYSFPNSSFPSNLTVVGDELFFSADNGETGTELFKLTLSDGGESGPTQITGSDGSDNLLGVDGAEEILALSGQDTVDSGGGNDTIDGGDGDDFLFSDGGDDSIIGGNGNDTLNSGGGNDNLLGGSGDDFLGAANGNDTLNGGENNDTLNGGNGDDRLFGENGDDRLVGSNGDDLLAGGSSNDRLNGGIGLDTLHGGTGDDVFVLRTDTGTDTILDFTLEGDRLGLARGLQFEDLSFDGNNILAGEAILATLDGVNAEQLTANDFSAV